MEKKTLLQAVSMYFGKLPGQELTELAGEVKELSQDDRNWFAGALSTALGVQVAAGITS